MQKLRSNCAVLGFSSSIISIDNLDIDAIGSHFGTVIKRGATSHKDGYEFKETTRRHRLQEAAKGMDGGCCERIGRSRNF